MPTRACKALSSDWTAWISFVVSRANTGVGINEATTHTSTIPIPAANLFLNVGFSTESTYRPRVSRHRNPSVRFLTGHQPLVRLDFIRSQGPFLAELRPRISQYFTWRMSFAAHKACRIFWSVHRRIRRLKLHGHYFSGFCPPENPDARFS